MPLIPSVTVVAGLTATGLLCRLRFGVRLYHTPQRYSGVCGRGLRAHLCGDFTEVVLAFDKVRTRLAYM